MKLWVKEGPFPVAPFVGSRFYNPFDAPHIHSEWPGENRTILIRNSNNRPLAPCLLILVTNVSNHLPFSTCVARTPENENNPARARFSLEEYPVYGPWSSCIHSLGGRSALITEDC